MAEQFGFSTPAEAVAMHFAAQCRGKHIIVTGANSGLGKETARALAAHNAIVTLAVRSRASGDEAIAEIKIKHPEAQLSLLELDLGDLASVKKAAETFLARNEPLHILINNAGVVMGSTRTLTKDGLESMFGVNHIGHFYFTKLLLNKLDETGTPEEPSRVVNVSSIANWSFGPREGIMFDHLAGSRNVWVLYGQSKIANILFTRELDRRMKEENRNVISVSLHPGNILTTAAARHQNFSTILSTFWALNWGTTIRFLRDGLKSIEVGSSTSVLAALDPGIQRSAHYADCAVETFTIHHRALDTDLAKKLWKFSEDIVEKMDKCQ